MLTRAQWLLWEEFVIRLLIKIALSVKVAYRKCAYQRSPNDSWTHKFVCLASPDEERVPTTAIAKEMLSFAGLGEKKVFVQDVDCTTEEFHDILFTCFPQLKNSGGFELLRCLPSSRDLEVIPPPMCHSPRLIRIRMSTARIYIRPIQNDLVTDEIDVVEDFVVNMNLCDCLNNEDM